MAQMSVEWKVLGVQDVLSAQDKIKQGEQKVTKSLEKEVNDRIKLEDRAAASAEKAHQKAVSGFEKAERDRIKALEKAIGERIKIEERKAKESERQHQKDIKAFESAEHKKTSILANEEKKRAAGEKKHNEARKKESQDTHNAIIRGLGLSGYYGPGRPAQTLEGIVGGLKGLVMGGASMAGHALLGGAAAGFGVGLEEYGTNYEWSTQLAHNQRVGPGGKKLSREAISAWMRGTAAESGVNESKIGELANQYAQGGGATTQNSMNFLAKMQMLLPQSNMSEISKTAGGLSKRVGESGMQAIIASAYKTGNMEQNLPKAQAEFEFMQNAGIRSGDVVGMQDILRVKAATQFKFKNEKASDKATEHLIDYAQKHGVMGATLGDTITNVSSQMSRSGIGTDTKGRVHTGGMEMEQFSAIQTIISSTKDMMGEFGKLDNSMKDVDSEAKEMDSEPLHQLKKTYNEIAGTLGGMMTGPAKDFAKFLHDNKDGIAHFMEGVTDRTQQLLDIMDEVTFEPIIAFLKDIGYINEQSLQKKAGARMDDNANADMMAAAKLRQSGDVEGAKKLEERAKLELRSKSLHTQLGASVKSEGEISNLDPVASKFNHFIQHERTKALRTQAEEADQSLKNWNKDFTKEENKKDEKTDIDKHAPALLQGLKDINATLKARAPLGPIISNQPK